MLVDVMQWIAILACVYVVMSAVSFGMYCWDKRRAHGSQWRTPEKTLLTIDLLGGWPGGLAAQRIFRHKNRKGSYQLRFWAIVALHAGVLGWLFAVEFGLV